jgi:hypothetical protein
MTETATAPQLPQEFPPGLVVLVVGMKDLGPETPKYYNSFTLFLQFEELNSLSDFPDTIQEVLVLQERKFTPHAHRIRALLDPLGDKVKHLNKTRIESFLREKAREMKRVLRVPENPDPSEILPERPTTCAEFVRKYLDATAPRMDDQSARLFRISNINNFGFSRAEIEVAVKNEKQAKQKQGQVAKISTRKPISFPTAVKRGPEVQADENIDNTLLLAFNAVCREFEILIPHHVPAFSNILHGLENIRPALTDMVRTVHQLQRQRETYQQEIDRLKSRQNDYDLFKGRVVRLESENKALRRSQTSKRKK